MVVVVVLLVIAAGVLRPQRLRDWMVRAEAAKLASTTVETELAERRDIAEFVTAGGKIQPLTLVKISPEVSGEIIDLPVKEGDRVKKGDLIVGLKRDYYVAARESAQAAYLASVANRNLAKATLDRAAFEYERVQKLFETSLVSESQFQEAKTSFEVAQAQHEASGHHAEMAKSAVIRADEDVAKTSVFSPISGIVARLSSQLGERVVGTATMAGTEIMQIADLSTMEARVDVGEIDVVLIQPGQSATLDVDAIRSRKFKGVVTYIANIPNNTLATGARSQEATKFEVRIRVTEEFPFRFGMSATAMIQTRSRSNVVAVPIQSVTTRIPPTGAAKEGKSQGKARKPIEVVFVLEGDRVRMVPVKRGISDESYVEIVSGLKEGDRVVTGSYRAINRDLNDGSKVMVAAQ